MSDPTRAAEHLVSTAEELDALASPVRRAVVQLLAAAGPMTVAELGTSLDRSAQGLYRHVRMLEKAGLVREIGVRGGGRGQSAVYDVIADHLRTTEAPLSAHLRGRVADGACAELRAVERRLRDGISDDTGRWQGRPYDTAVLTRRAWLTEDQLARLNTAIEGLFDELEPGPPTEGAQLVHLAVALTRGTR